MIDFEKKFRFTEEEWRACLKVLSVLKEQPTENPDNDRFKSLVQKIVRKARKEARKATRKSKFEHDIHLQKESVIVSNALAGVSRFAPDEEESKSHFQRLKLPKNCYSCSASYDLAHSFYGRLCPECASLNLHKRHQARDLQGSTAVITGCRVKVGYATTLKLLRTGANVIGTSRFPAVAMEQFEQEEDYDVWSDQLKIFGLDLRNIGQIERFIDYVIAENDRLDILINNAAQTINYPLDYYAPLISSEAKLLVRVSSKCLPNRTPIGDPMEKLVPQLSQHSSKNLNRFNQPVDTRAKTSWNSTLAEIDLLELLEVNVINQIAPFLLIKAFKGLMVSKGGISSNIVNVTSTEGIFSHANKTHYHPHTNMTKASLNMITRTSADEFSKDNIFMNSVDVGWISTGATEGLRKAQFDRAYVPPLDPVDGASRILDPIHLAMDGRPVFGKLFKDYREHQW